MARKAFAANDTVREKVRYLAGLGVRQDDIAKIIGCDPKTLRKRLRRTRSWRRRGQCDGLRLSVRRREGEWRWRRGGKIKFSRKLGIRLRLRCIHISSCIRSRADALANLPSPGKVVRLPETTSLLPSGRRAARVVDIGRPAQTVKPVIKRRAEQGHHFGDKLRRVLIGLPVIVVR